MKKVKCLLALLLIASAAPVYAADICLYENTGSAIDDMGTLLNNFNAGNRAMNAEDYDQAITSYTDYLACESILMGLRMKTTVSLREMTQILAEANSRRGIAYFNKGLHDKAIENYSAALARNGLAPLTTKLLSGIYYNRGGAYDAKGEKQKAIADFKKAAYYGDIYASPYLKSKHSVEYTPSREFQEAKAYEVEFSTEPYGAAELSYSGKTLAVNNTNGQDGYIPAAGGDKYADFSLSVTLKLTSGSPTSGNGIFFRGDLNDEKCCFLFNVTNDGKVAFYIAPKDPLDYGRYAFYPFIEGQTSGKAAQSAVKIGGPNKLGVEAIGDYIKLFVNNKEIATVPWQLRSEGAIGLFASGGNTLEYSDFTVKPLRLKEPRF